MNLKELAGKKAVEEVKDGYVVGLGTGSTTHFFIEELAKRAKDEELEIMGIATSFQSSLLAQQGGIPITSLDEHDIDLAVDGADEIDPELNLIKGGGAAHTLEKIVDYSAKKFIVIADDSKLVDVLGKFPVPVEIIPKSLKLVEESAMDMCADCSLRMGVKKDGPVITDNGNFVLDLDFKKIDSPECLEVDLNMIPGVVENGIFSQMVDKAIIGSPDGIKIFK